MRAPTRQDTDPGRLIFASAALGAELKGDEKGFRLKDVRFLIELFSNWLESVPSAAVPVVHNTQVMRYMEALVREGYARRVRGTWPRFRITRSGLLELLSEITERPRYLPLETFFFLYHFVGMYGARFEALIRRRGRQFPKALQLELRSMLDSGDMLERQIRYVKTEIKKLDTRIADSDGATDLARQMFSAGAGLDEVVLETQQQYPYQLNNQKPLKELFGELPEDLGHWELTVGSSVRAVLIHNPMRRMLQHYLAILLDMSEERDRAYQRTKP